MPALAGEDREPIIAMRMEGAALRIGQRRHDRQFGLGQFMQESVLLQDGGVAPATRAVELDDAHAALVQSHLVHPILVTVQGQQPAIARESGTLEGGENTVRRQAGEGCRVLRCMHAIPP